MCMAYGAWHRLVPCLARLKISYEYVYTDESDSSSDKARGSYRDAAARHPVARLPVARVEDRPGPEPLGSGPHKGRVWPGGRVEKIGPGSKNKKNI